MEAKDVLLLGVSVLTRVDGRDWSQ